MKLIIFSLLLIIGCHQVQPFIVSLISSIYQMYQIVNDAHDTYSKVITPNTQDLMDEILEIKDSVNQITKDVSTKIDQLFAQIMEQLPRIGQVNRGMETFSQHFNRISYLYQNFEELIRIRTPNARTLREFSTAALSYFSDSVSATLHALHELFIPTEVGHLADGLLTLIAANLEVTAATELGCNRGAPPEEQVYLLYTALLTAEIRGYMMQTFTYLVLENLAPDDYVIELQRTRRQTLVRVNQYMYQMSNVIKWSSRTFYECDPPEGYKRGVSVAEFEMFMSPYIAAEMTVKNQCSGRCEDVSLNSQKNDLPKCWWHDRVCHYTSKCSGRVYSCITLGQWNNDVCFNPAKEVASRRYLFLRESSNRYGNESDCYASSRRQFDSHDGCDYCLCTCVEDTPTSPFRHAVSLRPQVSNITGNKIVAGIKFVKTKDMLHLQIQQGEVKGDSIIPTTLEWVPHENMKIIRSNSASKNPTVEGDKGKKYEEGVDYHLLTYPNSAFGLDDIIAPDGYVVTGATFRLGSGRIIELSLRATPYDFRLGKLIVNDTKPSTWVTMYDVKKRFPKIYQDRGSRTAVPRHKNSKQVNFKDPTKKVSEPYSEIKLKQSNLEGDFEGTVYPMIDTRAVSTPSLFLLEGLGIIYKEPVDGSDAGYMALSLRAVSRKKFLDNEVTEDDLTSLN